MSRFVEVLVAAAVSAAMFVPSAWAEDVKTYSLSLKEKSFIPAEIKVPAGQAFVIEFSNENASPAELESAELHIEKVAPGNGKIVIRVKALEAGTYGFVDEFQEDEAKGVIIAE